MKNLSKISNYFHPHRILDIGARVGEFYGYCKAVYPSSYYYLIEGNPNCAPILEKLGADFSIELLSDSKKSLNFYINKNDVVSSGCSYYRESITNFFTDDTSLVKTIEAVPLDDMFTEDSIFDLIKIDTQGSELDIIRGGLKLISNAKGLLIECQLEQCNENAPLYDEVKRFVEKIGFEEKVILDTHSYENRIVQIDVLFSK